MAPTAGVQIPHMRLRELGYADDMSLMAASPEQLQALIDALSSCCAMLHMEISVQKTKVMVVLPVPVSAAAFSCNGNPVEQVSTFKYLGLHFHESGALVHLIHVTVVIKEASLWALGKCRTSAVCLLNSNALMSLMESSNLLVGLL